MTSSFPDPGIRAGTATLVIEVPHWSATIALIDNDLRPVDGLGKVVAEPDGTGRLSADLSIGAYEVQVTLDGKSQARWIVLEPGDAKIVSASSWDTLRIETAMPLAQPKPTAGADDLLAPVAAAASMAAPLPAERRCEAPEARVSLFATAIVPPSGTPADFDLDVQLLDEDGALVADLAAPQSRPTLEPGRMWRCAFDLDPGYYVLRVRDGAGRRLQPLYLCAGMESHLFFRCDGSPLLDTLSLDMGPLGEGYDPEKDRVVAADAILTALRAPDADRLILGSARLGELVRGEDRNPWLAVLAGYALVRGDQGGEAGGLLAEIRGFLRGGPLTGHPDVVALLLDETAPEAPLRYPPMLRAGVQRLSAYAIDHAGAIEPGSPLDRLGNRLIADSAWTAWSEARSIAPAADAPVPLRDEAAPPVAAAAAAPGAALAVPVAPARGLLSRLLSVLAPLLRARGAADPEVASGAVSLPAPIRALVQAFPANAPVYPLADYQQSSGVAMIAEGGTIATHAALIEAAITGLPSADHPAPSEVRVAMVDGSAELLDVSAEAVSRLSGVALDRVVRNFRHLKEAGPADAAAGALGEVRESLGSLIAAIEAKQIGADADTPRPVATVTPVEARVERLQVESARLRSFAATADAAVGERAGRLADRLAATAERLLRHAHLVLLADETGALRYGNRLLRDRLVARGEAGRDAMARLRARLAAQTTSQATITAADLSPMSPEGQAGVCVAVQRTVVRGADDSVQGHVYYLRDAAIRDFDPASDLRLDAAVSQVTLQVSLVEFGDVDGVSSALDRLEALVTEVEEVLASGPSVLPRG